jgi:hypothetical protein
MHVAAIFKIQNKNVVIIVFKSLNAKKRFNDACIVGTKEKFPHIK